MGHRRIVRTFFFLFLLPTLILFAFQFYTQSYVFAESVNLVRDFNDKIRNITVHDSCTVGGINYLVVDDYTHGIELWRTDGTVPGTTMIKDVTPGVESTFKAAGEDNPVNIARYKIDCTTHSNKLYFLDGAQNARIYSSDGTSGGTGLLFDFASVFSGSYRVSIYELHANNGKLFASLYRIPSSQSNYEYTLWSSNDGINWTQIKSGLSISNFVSVSGGVLFTGYDENSALWFSDGTQGGTYKVLDNYSIDSDAYPLINASEFALALRDNNFDSVLGIYNSSQGSWSPLNFLSADMQFDQILGAVGNRVIFKVNKLEVIDGDSYINGYEVWATEGALANTLKLVDISGFFESFDDSQIDAISTSNLVFFDIHENGAGDKLWRSDGTPAGTFAIDFDPSEEHYFNGQAAALGSTLAFVMNDTLYTTDGSEAGTASVFTPPQNYYIGTLIATGNKSFFDLTQFSNYERDTYFYNGILAEYFPLDIVGSSQNSNANIIGRTTQGIFMEATGNDGIESFYFVPFSNDIPHKVFPDNFPSLSFIGATDQGGLFMESKSTSFKLIKSDGTQGIYSEIYSQQADDIDWIDYEKAGNIFYILLEVRVNNSVELRILKTDLSAEGTSLSQPINGLLQPNLVSAGEYLLIIDEDYDYESAKALYSTDGTAAGTIPLIPMNQGFSEIDWITLGNDVYIVGAKNGSHSLYRLNSSGFTFEVQMPQAFSETFSAFYSTGIAGRLIYVPKFILPDGYDYGSYAYDIQTKTVEYVAPIIGGDGSYSFFSVKNGEGYYGFGHDSFGGFLYTTNGTAAGSEQIASNPLGVTFGYSKIYFGGTPLGNDSSGNELLEYDPGLGTSRVITDINAGRRSSFPRDLVFANNKAYFTAYNSAIGRELWEVTFDDICPNDVNKLTPGLCGCGIKEIYDVPNAAFYCEGALPTATPTSTPSPTATSTPTLSATASPIPTLTPTSTPPTSLEPSALQKSIKPVIDKLRKWLGTSDTVKKGKFIKSALSALGKLVKANATQKVLAQVEKKLKAKKLSNKGVNSAIALLSGIK